MLKKRTLLKLIGFFALLVGITYCFLTIAIDKGEEKLAAGRLAILAGEKAVAQGKIKLAAGQMNLKAGEQRLAQGKAQLMAGEQALSQGEQTYNKIKHFPFGTIGSLMPIHFIRSIFDAVQKKVAIGHGEIKSGKAAVAEGKAEVAAGEVKVAQGKNRLELGYQKLKAGELKLQQGIAEYVAGVRYLSYAKVVQTSLAVIEVILLILIFIVGLFCKEKTR